MAYGNFIKRFCTIGWALVGIVVATLLIQRGEVAFADPRTRSAMPRANCCSPAGSG